MLSDVPVRVLVPLPDEGGRDGVAVEIVRITPPVVTRLVRFFPALIGVIAVLQVVAIVVLAWQTTRPVSRLLAAVRPLDGVTSARVNFTTRRLAVE